VDILSVVGFGGAGAKFARYVSQRTGVPAFVLNDSGADLNIPGSRLEPYVSVSPGMLATTFPWIKRIGTEHTFVLAGLGGVLGTSAVRIFSRARKGIHLYGLFTLPFFSENQGRKERAKEALGDIEENFQAYILLDNDGLMRHYSNLPIHVAMDIPAEVMKHVVMDFRNIVLKNITSLKLGGKLGVGVGFGVGKERIRVAIEDALDSPWISDGSRIMLFSGELDEEDVRYVVREYDADFYAVHRTPEYGEEVKVTILTTQ